MKQLIKIDNIQIRQDEDGRYSLNDLHKAAGGKEKDKPSNFIRSEQTQELIKEISQVSEMSLGLKVIHGGIYKGTYVCKELVYAYAMWVNPKFHLKVIRTFDMVVTGNLPAVQKVPTIPMAMPVTLKYYNRLPVLLVKDIAQIFNASEGSIHSNMKRAGFIRSDYETLSGVKLQVFKENNGIIAPINALTIIYENGFKKLCKYFKSNAGNIYPEKVEVAPEKEVVLIELLKGKAKAFLEVISTYDTAKAMSSEAFAIGVGSTLQLIALDLSYEANKLSRIK